jgi:hypothetical protein
MSIANRYQVNWIIASIGWTNTWWKAGAPVQWRTKSNSMVWYIRVWTSVDAAVTIHLHTIVSVENCDTKICERDSCFQGRLSLQVWFQFLVAWLFHVHRTLQSWMDSGYSLNQQCWIICSQLHKWIAVNFSTLLRLIQYCISLIIQGQKDCLSYIQLMYRILRHGSRIPGLPEVCSKVFPCSRMKFRPIADPFSCRVWWSQIWHRIHVLFTG